MANKYEEVHVELNNGGRFFRRDYETQHGESYQYLWDLNKLPSRVDRVLKMAELINWAKDNQYTCRIVNDQRPTAIQYAEKYKQSLEVIYLDPIVQEVDTELSSSSNKEDTKDVTSC